VGWQALIGEPPAERAEDLRVETPRPSLAELFAAERGRKGAKAEVTAEHYRATIGGRLDLRAGAGSGGGAGGGSPPTSPPPLVRAEAQVEASMAQGHGLLRVYGFLFAMKCGCPCVLRCYPPLT